jgi:uncharacterized protein (TIGR00290 family)
VMSAPRAVMSWSGGKDSALALFRTLRDQTHDVRALITTVTSEYDRISMHGVRRELLEMQAAAIGIPLVVSYIPPSANNATYEAAMLDALRPFREEGISEVICGDLFLRDIREYRDRLFGSIGMRGIYPLWMENTSELAHEFIELGFKAVVCSSDPKSVPDTVAGSQYDHALLDSLPAKCDPCAENGEFHTFVYDGPIFDQPVPISVGEMVERGGFCFSDIVAKQ